MTSESSAPVKSLNQLVVLDAWPIMEWVRGRSPVDLKVDEMLMRAQSGQQRLCMSRINLGEVYYTTAKDYGESVANAILEQLRFASIEIVSITDDDIDEAAQLKSRYKISYADGFAAVLSMQRKAPLLTGDAEFRQLESDGLLELRWMGK